MNSLLNPSIGTSRLFHLADDGQNKVISKLELVF